MQKYEDEKQYDVSIVFYCCAAILFKLSSLKHHSFFQLKVLVEKESGDGLDEFSALYFYSVINRDCHLIRNLTREIFTFKLTPVGGSHSLVAIQQKTAVPGQILVVGCLLFLETFLFFCLMSSLNMAAYHIKPARESLLTRWVLNSQAM